MVCVFLSHFGCFAGTDGCVGCVSLLHRLILLCMLLCVCIPALLSPSPAHLTKP